MATLQNARTQTERYLLELSREIYNLNSDRSATSHGQTLSNVSRILTNVRYNFSVDLHSGENNEFRSEVAENILTGDRISDKVINSLGDKLYAYRETDSYGNIVWGGITQLLALADGIANELRWLLEELDAAIAASER